MPFFRFVCSSCGAEIKKLLKDAKTAKEYSSACNVCGHATFYALGTPEAQERETLDEDRGKTALAGVKEMINARASEHFKKKDIAKIIDSQGAGYAQELGFVDEAGKAK